MHLQIENKMRAIERIDMKTVLKVGEDVMKDTIRCRNGFSCLDSKEECLCEIEFSPDSGRVCFVKNDKNRFCEYKMSFGYSFVCTCPTRRELYKLYKV